VDRRFDSNNQIPYQFSPDGVSGSALLVNGAPQPYFDVEAAHYRLRFLNASNSRSIDLKLSNGAEMVQVATESGLLPAPVSRSHILLGPAERAEVVVDFTHDGGRTITLNNSIGFGVNLATVMQFRVSAAVAQDDSAIPEQLRAAPVFEDGPTTTTRTWIFGQNLDDGRWTINNNGFDPARVDATPKLDTVERWIFANATQVDHIVHIHDVDWQIVSRVLADPTQTAAEPSITDGLSGEAGLRESFRLRPNEVVTIVSRFTDHLGRYVLHCHILEHEDYAMMAQFDVVP
jgi:spore coat protein A